MPQYSKQKVVYTTHKPAFVVAWLKDHLAGLLAQKETFMPHFAGEIVPTNFTLAMGQHNKLNINMEFRIDEEDVVELVLAGKLHRSEKGEVGVEWERISGNDYWLTAVLNNFNAAIECLL